MQAQIQWHLKTVSQSLDDLDSTEHGLSQEKAQSRLREFGLNKLPEAKSDPLAVIFLRQFKSPLIYILFIAAIIVFFLGEFSDGMVIVFVLFFNAVIGTFQEGKAQNTLLALKKFSETKATVIRDGNELIISDREIVPGDIIILQEGEKVPADARVINSHNLKVDEATLTGESVPVHKIHNEVGARGASAIEQKNIIFKGTHIVAGNGRAVVIATGIATEIGKISEKVAIIDTETPLKTDIRYLSRLIIIAVASIVSILFLLGIVLGRPIKEMFITGVSLAISMIPEGLPIVLTLVLAQGVWKMGKRHALVKKLQAIGSLGEAQVIAVDKTGTITKNEMMVQEAYIDGVFFKIHGNGYEGSGDIELLDSSNNSRSEIISPLDYIELILAGRIAAFCSNARVARYKEARDQEKRWQITGDPTEAALLVFSEKIGFTRDDLLLQHPVIEEIPFDYKIKYHAMINMVENRPFASVVGAPEIVLKLSSNIWRRDLKHQLYEAGKKQELTAKEREELESVFTQMSRRGLRVLAIAAKSGFSTKDSFFAEIDGLTFIGFLGIRDTIRSEAEHAITKAQSAGIKVVMITGDHKMTAQAIAEEAGIFHQGEKVITGHELDAFNDAELLTQLPNISVFARVTPEHKLRIIKAYQEHKQIIAMTGDGVNDAPSLVAADIGVAMGKIGTDVAKEASDIVLLDDNFQSIVSAIEEGRSIFRTIKKVLLYLFSTNIGEMLTITGTLVLGYPLPILPAQIIWLNLVTDGFLDVALAMEPKEKDLLSRTFEKHKKYLIDSLMLKRIFVMAVPMMLGTLFLFSNYFRGDLTKAWTISLTCLAVFQWFNAWNCRSATESVFKTNPFSNKFLVGSMGIVIILQLFAVYNPLAQKILHTVPLAFSEWLTIIPVAFSIIVIEEIRKFFYRRTLVNAK